VSTIDPTPPAAVRPEGGAPAVPEQRVHYDGSLTQQRVDSIFRALVARRALEERARLGEQPGPEDHDQ
jgi:hypothetical protein